MIRSIMGLTSFIACFICANLASFGQPVLKTGDVVTVCGDSITQQSIYSAYIEEYILMCQPLRDVKTMQCGWGGATAPHFAGHMKNDILTLHPTVATTSYGMNDGGDEAGEIRR